MKTRIYGASDDLIEIGGAIEAEVGCYDHKRPINILASDNTEATIFYDGDWTIVIKKAGTGKYLIVGSVGDDKEHTHEDAIGCSSYSDVLVLNDIEWIKVGRKTFKSK